jgi:hypothetical protein
MEKCRIPAALQFPIAIGETGMQQRLQILAMLSPWMAIPLKEISMAFRRGGLIFEGLRKLRLGRNEKFCQGFCGATLKDQPTAM